MLIKYFIVRINILWFIYFTKAEILGKCVIRTMVYSFQRWSLTEKQKRELQICQRRMERKILHITHGDRIRNDVIRCRRRMTDVATAAASRKWTWGGHVARMDHQRWTDKVTMWNPRIGWRNVGRQKNQMGGPLQFHNRTVVKSGKKYREMETIRSTRDDTQH